MKKNLMKLCTLAMAAVMALGLTGCSDTEVAEGEWEWETSVEIICPWGTGGGADTTLRQFAAALEEELGVSVVVNNKEGAGGVTGVQFFSEQPADGYTYLLCTPSPLLAQISGATDFDVYGTINPLVQVVHDVNVLMADIDAPYDTYQELVDYVAANPGVVKAGVMTINGLDAACIQAAFGDTVEAVAYSDGSQLNADVIGGHVSLACVGPAEVSALVASGDMKCILSFTEEPLTLEGYEGVDYAGDVAPDALFGPARGIFYLEGTPDAALEAFEAAAEKAVASEAFQTWAVNEGLDQREGWKNTADYTASWDADYEDLTAMFG